MSAASATLSGSRIVTGAKFDAIFRKSISTDIYYSICACFTVPLNGIIASKLTVSSWISAAIYGVINTIEAEVQLGSIAVQGATLLIVRLLVENADPYLEVP